MDGFSQEIFENKWSLNARNQKLTGFVSCVYSSRNSWNFGRGSRLFFLKFSDLFSMAKGVLFIGKDFVVFERSSNANHHTLDVDLFLKQAGIKEK